VTAALRSHPGVEDAAVVGLEHDEWRQVVAALVTSGADIPVDAAGLRAYCRERLEAAAVPKYIELADALPRTPSGTVDRAAVRDRLRAARRRGGL
jgi:O-succinylbenzoic acid--CoA ligase